MSVETESDACGHKVTRHGQPFVNETLSRGLADRALAALVTQGARYCAAVPPILRKPIRSKKAVSAVTAALTELGERTRLIQIIGSTPNGRNVTTCQFVPNAVTHYGNGANTGICFYLHQFLLTSRGIELGPDTGIALVASAHAVERLFLRLNTLDLATATTELHDAMLLSLPIGAIGRSLSLRQVALPTSSGAFLCELPSDETYPVAKTWLSNGALGTRWSPIVERIRTAVAVAGGENALASLLVEGTDVALADQSHVLVTALRNALARFGWLKDIYTHRPDPIGDTWKQARTAAAETFGVG